MGKLPQAAQPEKEIVQDQPQAAQPEKAAHFEEWRMEKEKGEWVKNKLLRSCVKITQEEADVLNAGSASSDGLQSIMYLSPETKADA